MNIETIVAVIVGAIVTAMLLAPLRKFRFEFIVPEGYAGLLYHHGKFVERLDAGRHIRWGRLWTIQPADLRTLSSIGRDFDLVIACDNALPHLLSEQEIQLALGECARCLRPGGGCLFSVRDYGEPGVGSEFHPYGIRELPQGRYVLFQVWDWTDAHYDLSLYLVHEDGSGPVRTEVFRSRYFAITPARILELTRQAGFERVRRVDDGFYQPVIVGTKPERR